MHIYTKSEKGHTALDKVTSPGSRASGLHFFRTKIPLTAMVNPTNVAGMTECNFQTFNSALS